MQDVARHGSDDDVLSAGTLCIIDYYRMLYYQLVPEERRNHKKFWWGRFFDNIRTEGPKTDWIITLQFTLQSLIVVLELCKIWLGVFSGGEFWY